MQSTHYGAQELTHIGRPQEKYNRTSNLNILSI